MHKLDSTTSASPFLPFLLFIDLPLENQAASSNMPNLHILNYVHIIQAMKDVHLVIKNTAKNP